MSSRKASGTDGWRVHELKELPLPLWQIMAEVLQRVERDGAWPKALTQASVAMIPKGSSDAAPLPLALRPISIMSVVYRVWAATRLKQLRHWQEGWCSRHQHGFRPNHGCEDVLWQFGLLMEEACLRGEPDGAFTAHYDFAKCFDTIPHTITLALAAELGMPEGIGRALAGMYRDLERRFRIPGGVGEAFRATNGILQGCPLSVVLVNVLLVVWMRELGSLNIPGAAIGVYADDVSVKAASPLGIARITCSLCAFCEATGLRINPGKSCWCTVPHRAADEVGAEESLPVVWANGPVVLREEGSRRTLAVHGVRIQQVAGAKCLGVTLKADPKVEPLISSRMAKATEYAERVAKLPLPQARKADVIGMLVVPSGMYGGIVDTPSPEETRRLQTSVHHAIMDANAHNLRSAPLALNLLRKGHIVDPSVYLRYNRVLSWRRLCVKGIAHVRSALTACHRTVWLQQTASTGPAGAFATTLREMRWKWSGPTRLLIPNTQAHYLPEEKRTIVGIRPAPPKTPGRVGPDWSLLDLCEVVKQPQVDIFAHLVREALRRWRWRDGSVAHRPRLLGIAGGIDPLTTQVLLLKKQNHLTAYEEGFLRHTLVDGQRCGERFAKRATKGTTPPASCVYCDSDEPESPEHLFWRCTAWDEARMSYDGALSAFSEAWPPCLKSCGILPTVRVLTAKRSSGTSWDCDAVDKRVLWQVQRMMVAVVAARHRRDVDGDPDVRKKRRAYPFEFSPVSTRRFANTLRTRAPAGWQSLYLGDTVRMALSWYLAGLQWGEGGEFTVIEMAVHFVVTTGCDLISFESGETDAGEAMMRRDRALRMALQAMQTGELPTLKRSRWLFQLGGPRNARLAFVLRPLVDANTTAALKRLEACMCEARLASEAVGREAEDQDEVQETAPHTLLRSDGAARGNGKKKGVGRSGIGFAAWRGGQEVKAFHARLPDGTTNMVAEYQAAIAALRWLLAEAMSDGRKIDAAAVFDCETMVDQIRGIAAARSVGCRPLRAIAAGLVAALQRRGKFEFRHEKRDSNCRADELANAGADEAAVTTAWPAWWSVKHHSAQATSTLSAGGEQGGWMGSFCLSEFRGKPSERPWEAWLDDLDGPAAVGGLEEKKQRRAEKDRRARAGEPEAPA